MSFLAYGVGCLARVVLLDDLCTSRFGFSSLGLTSVGCSFFWLVAYLLFTG